MSYHRGVARDTAGNSLNEASVTVLEPGTTTEASLFSEETLTTSLDNPITTGVDGVYEFYVDPGYYDIQVAKSGFTTVTLEDEVVGGVFGFAYSAGGSTYAMTTAETMELVKDDGWTIDWTLQYAGSFELAATTEKLKYVGAPTIYLRVHGSIMFQNNSNDNVHHVLEVNLNGSAVSPLRGRAQSTSHTSEGQSMAVDILVQVETDDEISLSFQNGTGNNTIEMSEVHISAERVG